MKLIFAVLYVSQTMGRTRCYKTEGFLQQRFIVSIRFQYYNDEDDDDDCYYYCYY